MNITTDGIPLSSKDEQDIGAGVSAMGDPELTVLVTENFDETIRKFTGLEGYSSDRGSGLVGAKTIDDQIVVNGAALNEQYHGGLERLLAHEAGHVLIYLRNEGYEGRHHLADTQLQWNVVALAGKGLEEFRIERRLAELGYEPASATGLGSWGDVLFEANTSIIESVLKQQSVDSFAAQVTGVADLLVTTLAYTIGSLAGAGSRFEPERLGGYARDNWEDYIAETWPERVSLYETLSTCNEEVSSEDWERVLVKARDVELELFKSLGFTITAASADEPEGFWRTGSDQVFNDRIKRLKGESAEEV